MKFAPKIVSDFFEKKKAKKVIADHFETRVCLDGFTKESLQETLSSENLSVENSLQIISRIFPELMQMSVGVREGYTLEEHMKFIISQLESCRNSLGIENFDTDMPLWKFRLFMLLHDIGKPLAVKHTGDRRHQHIYTKILVEKTLQKLGFGVGDITMFNELLSADVLGGYLQNKKSKKETLREIHRLAKAVGKTPVQAMQWLEPIF